MYTYRSKILHYRVWYSPQVITLNRTMDMDKFFLYSKTIQGILITLIPVIAGLFGWEWSTDDTGSINEIINLGLAFGGAIWAWYGRAKATVPLSVTPTTPAA